MPSTPEGFVLQIRGFEVLVDREDVPRILAGGPWRPHKGSQRQYFVHTTPRPEHANLLLHRFIVSAPPGFDVDHINGNAYDNRKSNLRICTHAENQRNLRRRTNNKSGYKGVSIDKKSGMWRARITTDGREKLLGLFETPELAASAYAAAARELHGNYSRVE